MFNVVLVEPQIPQNAGNIARLCAAADMQLIIVGKPGFVLHDRYLKRAGLDYWEYVRIKHVPDRESYFQQLDMSHTYLLTTKAKRPYTCIQPQPGDTFLFGAETGWRGFALPRLQAYYEPLAASLILSLAWAVWHLPNFFIPEMGTWQGSLLLYARVAVALTIMHTWTYNCT